MLPSPSSSRTLPPCPTPTSCGTASPRCTSLARTLVPVLKRCRATVVTAAPKILNISGESTHPWRTPCFTPNHSGVIKCSQYIVSPTRSGIDLMIIMGKPKSSCVYVWASSRLDDISTLSDSHPAPPRPFFVLIERGPAVAGSTYIDRVKTKAMQVALELYTTIIPV